MSAQMRKDDAANSNGRCHLFSFLSWLCVALDCRPQVSPSQFSQIESFQVLMESVAWLSLRLCLLCSSGQLELALN